MLTEVVYILACPRDFISLPPSIQPVKDPSKIALYSDSVRAPLSCALFRRSCILLASNS